MAKKKLPCQWCGTRDCVDDGECCDCVMFMRMDPDGFAKKHPDAVRNSGALRVAGGVVCVSPFRRAERTP